ncbi:response regulator transcription factor [Thiomicrospira sp. WB1]|uniref:response regulator transcription factor n=1 Tax=Thiomicrospira sp. WB1 TaxID=1685380 RepID=UPI00074B223F|nr:response regulator transcription factor [Thiomicrospira sp. WB1]KUJ71191.1 hypothetical protein AVO41_10025 [Thiomicrospira sp. WB1]
METICLYLPQPSVAEHWENALNEPYQKIRSLADFQQIQRCLWVAQYQPDVSTEFIDNLLAQQQPVLLVSNQPNEQEGLSWLKKGVRGYLNSFAHAEVIGHALAAIRQGNTWVGQNIMQALIQGVTTLESQTNRNQSWRERLSDRETETVEAILQGKSNREIAQAMNITERTVKSHVHHILEKLEAKDRLNLVLKIQNWHKVC